MYVGDYDDDNDDDDEDEDTDDGFVTAGDSHMVTSSHANSVNYMSRCVLADLRFKFPKYYEIVSPAYITALQVIQAWKGFLCLFGYIRMPLPHFLEKGVFQSSLLFLMRGASLISKEIESKSLLRFGQGSNP